MSIGSNIAKLRKANKLTQAELGEKLNVTNQTVSKWESGVSMPDVMLLPVIANIFGIPMDKLYEENIDPILLSGEACETDSVRTDNRLLIIFVDSSEDNIKVKMPLAIINTFLGSSILKSYIGDDIPIETFTELLNNNFTGMVVDLNINSQHIRVTIENIENSN